jgi:DNA-binding response OmpR family regulator
MVYDKIGLAGSISFVETGIGSSIKEHEEIHNGTMRVERVQDVETTFVIPFFDHSESFTEAQKLQKSVEVIATHREDCECDNSEVVFDLTSGKPELLIIEPNAEFRQLLTEEFSSDFSVVSTDDGIQGIQLTIERTPDLIISDIALRGKDGLEVCKEVKGGLRTSHIPLILLGENASTDDQVAGLESGADIYLIKPVNLRVLRAHVTQIVSSRRKLYAKYSQDIYLMPEKLTVNVIDKEFLQKAVDYVDRNLLNTQLSVETIADLYSISRSQVYRKIKALTGQTVVEFIRTIRLKQSLKLMEERRYTLSEIAFRTGFNSLSYFTRSFKDQYGKTPSEYAGKYH